MKMKFGRPYRRRVRRRAWHGPGIGALACLTVCALAFLSVWVFLQLRPAIAQVAASRMEALATEAIHQTVQAAFSQQGVGYEDLMTLSRNTAGQVTAVTANAPVINRLKSDLSLQILNRLSAAGDVGFSVPMGSLTGSVVLSGLGPDVQFRFVPYGSVAVDFRSAFTQAGINQTRQEVYLDVKTRVSAILPGFPADATVSTSVLVAETLIVGNVPDTYANVESGDGAERYLFDILK